MENLSSRPNPPTEVVPVAVAPVATVAPVAPVTQEVLMRQAPPETQTAAVVRPVPVSAFVAPSPPTMAGRVIWYIDGALSILLAFRFVLALLGANVGNAFAEFIHGATTPFVAPFLSLFGKTSTYGTSHLEVSTLVALAVYALVAWGLVKLVTITRPQLQ